MRIKVVKISVDNKLGQLDAQPTTEIIFRRAAEGCEFDSATYRLEVARVDAALLGECIFAMEKPGVVASKMPLFSKEYQRQFVSHPAARDIEEKVAQTIDTIAGELKELASAVANLLR